MIMPIKKPSAGTVQLPFPNVDKYILVNKKKITNKSPCLSMFMYLSIKSNILNHNVVKEDNVCKGVR